MVVVDYRPSCSALEYGIFHGLRKSSVRETQIPAEQSDHTLGEINGCRLLIEGKNGREVSKNDLMMM